MFRQIYHPRVLRRFTEALLGLFSLRKTSGKLYNENNPPSIAMNKEFLTQTVRANTNITDSDDNWNLLLYKEAYHIKRSSPSLNIGLKASRELCLFS